MALDARRRAFLRSAALTAVGMLAPRAVRAATDEAWYRSTLIGTSQAGQPLTAYQVGHGPRRVLLIGGQHGGPEVNTVELATLLLSFFVEWPRELPPSLTLDVLPLANPDGLYLNSRLYLSGIDPNRNWRSPDWSFDGYDSDGRFRPGLGGAGPFSERETRALASWVARRPPELVINYHSAGGFVLGRSDGPSGQLAAAYARASQYWWPSDEIDPFPYPATGTIDAWLDAVRIPNLFVELTDFDDVEIERNLAGVRAVVGLLA